VPDACTERLIAEILLLLAVPAWVWFWVARRRLLRAIAEAAAERSWARKDRADAKAERARAETLSERLARSLDLLRRG